jgi:1-acyl-sn-glycerol-3-phosphate acyltransferase
MRVFDVPRSCAFYAVFYIGSIPLVVFAALMAGGPRPLFRRAVRRWSDWHRWCARVLLGQRIRIEGAMPSTPVLFAIKHESFFEAIDLPRLLESPGVFAKAELLRIPVWGPGARRYGLVEVEREAGAKALRRMIAAAKGLVADGRPLAIFPEGTRVPHGQSPELKSGFAGLYKLLGLPVVAVAVDSGPLYHRWIKLPGMITYRFSEPIPPGLERDEAEAQVRRAINALNAA